MNIAKLILAFLFITFLSGCGGGSGDSSSSPTPTPTTPTNRAPVISLQQSAFTLPENTVGTFGIQISDADGDTVTVTVNAIDIVANYSESESAIIVEAPNVAAEQIFAVNVTATDDKGASTSQQINVTVQNVNIKPEILLDSTSLSIAEKTSRSVGIQISDADGDEVSVTIDASDITVNYSETNSAIIIEAPEVTEEQVFSIIIIATDVNGGTDEAELLVTVTKNDPPSVRFTDTAEYQIVERTFFTMPFEVSDPDTSITDLILDAVLEPNFMTNQEPVGFETTIDVENKILRIDVGRPEIIGVDDNNNYIPADYTLTLNVSDGVNLTSASFVFDVIGTNELLLLELESPSVFIVQGNQKNVSYNMTGALDGYRVLDFYYLNEPDLEDNRLDFSIDIETQTITVIAKPGSFRSDGNNSIALRLEYAENDVLGKSYTKTFTVNIREAISQNEINIEDKINTLYKITSLGSEYEEVAYFVNSYLYLSNRIDNNEYEINKENIFLKREIWYAGGFGLVELLREKLALSDELSVDAEYQKAFNSIEREIARIDQLQLFLIVEVLNNLISQDPNNLFPIFLEEDFFDLNAEYPSRFVGNSKYGSYNTEGIWNFNEEYQIIEPVIRKLQGRINRN
ncbi:hypothetical protein [Brumicola nitratireducens]|uniref:hypothetical protein n=1 Tax=Brumicola nitratireducens TaxID=300231 RepID=UPI0011D25463|nr:hypothetical protein [Glaciecola nitratireducens]